MSNLFERILRIIAVALALSVGAFSTPALAVKYTGGEYGERFWVRLGEADYVFASRLSR